MTALSFVVASSMCWSAPVCGPHRTEPVRGGHVVRHAVPELLQDGSVGVVLEIAPGLHLALQPTDVDGRGRASALKGRRDRRYRRQPVRPRPEIPLPRAHCRQHRLVRNEEVRWPHPTRRSPVAVLSEGEAPPHLASPVRHPFRPAREEQIVEVPHHRVACRLYGRRARFRRRYRRVHLRHRTARELPRRCRRVAAQRESRALSRARDLIVVELQHVRVVRADVKP